MNLSFSGVAPLIVEDSHAENPVVGEAGTTCGHQIYPLHTHDWRGMQQFFNHPSAQPMTLEIPATTMSQSTALLKPSEVALPNPTSLLPRQRLTTASLPASNRRSCEKLRPRAQKAWRSKSLCSLSNARLGCRSGPRPSKRRPGAPGAWWISRIGAIALKDFYNILVPGHQEGSNQGERACLSSSLRFQYGGGCTEKVLSLLGSRNSLITNASNSSIDWAQNRSGRLTKGLFRPSRLG